MERTLGSEQLEVADNPTLQELRSGLAGRGSESQLAWSALRRDCASMNESVGSITPSGLSTRL
jgi:hypothetical protein